VVRRNQGTAIRELERLGYTVDRPKDSLMRSLISRLVRAPQQRPAPHDELSDDSYRR
jgi:hypothetical protein